MIIETQTLVTQRIPAQRAVPIRAGSPRHSQQAKRFRDRIDVIRIAFWVVLVVLAVVYGTNLVGWPMFNTDDEGTYFAQAWSVLHKQELAHYTYWYDHPPVGWLQLALFIEPLSWFMGSFPAVVAGRAVMVLYTVVTAALLYRLGRNLKLHPVAALAAPLLWGLCPLTIFEGRQIFLDNMQLPWLVGAFVLATDGGRRLQMHILSGLLFAVAVLTKETAVFAGPAILLAVWVFAYRPTRLFSAVGWAAIFSLTVAAYPLYALIKDELLPGAGHVSLYDAIEWQLAAREGSGFLLDPDSVSNQVLNSWLDQDVFLIVAGGLAAAGCLRTRRLWPVSAFLACFIAVALRPSGYLPQMFVVVMLPFAALAVCAVVDLLRTSAARGSLGVRRIVNSGVAVLAAAGAVALLTAWYPQIRFGMTVEANRPYEEAIEYVEQNLPRDSVILTDDIAWNDLVRAGWPSDGFSGAVWYYKIDRDSEARAALPNGWRDVDYVLVGRPMGLLVGTASLNANTDPQVMASYENSDVIRSWGPAEWRVELRKVRG